jgi:hypothetical protein
MPISFLTLEGSVSKDGSFRNVNIVLGVFTDFHMKGFILNSVFQQMLRQNDSLVLVHHCTLIKLYTFLVAFYFTSSRSSAANGFQCNSVSFD